MKILQLMNRVPWPLKDGGALGIYNYTKGYHNAGCEVTVATLNTSKHFVKDIPTELSSIATWQTCFIDNQVKPLGALKSLINNTSYNVVRFYSQAFEQMLIQLLKRQTFDVIVFESVYMALYVETVRLYSDAVLVLRQHNVEYKIWNTLSKNEANPVKKYYLQILTKRLKKFEQSKLNSFDAIVPITQSDLDDFRKMNCHIPAWVSPFGLDITEYDAGEIETEPIVFHLGSMEWMPNQEAIKWFLQEVWPIIHLRYPSLTCEIAGRGMPKEMTSMNVPNVTIHAEVKSASDFMRNKSIMIVPLFAGSGIRIKILEGFAMGKAIVTTTLGVQGIACQHEKHLLIADGAAAFADAICKLVGSPELRNHISINARKLATEVYDNNKVIQQLLNFYEQQITHKNKTHVI